MESSVRSQSARIILPLDFGRDNNAAGSPKCHDFAVRKPWRTAISLVMKERTHKNRQGGVTTADRPRSVEEIDLERIIWDPEYRLAIKPLLDPANTTKRGDPRSGGRGRRRPD